MQDFTVFIQHHLSLSLALALVFILSMAVEFIRQKRAAERLSPTQVTQMINHQHAVVVDLRSADAFAKGHILGAISFPASEIKDKSKKIEKFKTKPLVLVCAKGHDSPKIASLLKNQGYHVHTLDGGITNWVNAALPLVKD